MPAPKDPIKKQEWLNKLKGRPSPWKGKKLSKEWRENLSKAHKGNKHSPETRKKMSQSRMGKGSHYFIDGRSKNPKWRVWIKNRRNRIKRRKGNPEIGFHTQGDWDTLLAQYNWTCPRCGKKEPVISLTRDHIVPLSKGGSDNIENIQPLCMPCNLWKSTKIISYKSLPRNGETQGQGDSLNWQSMT